VTVGEGLRAAAVVGVSLGAGAAVGEGMPIAESGIGVGDGRAGCA